MALTDTEIQNESHDRSESVHIATGMTQRDYEMAIEAILFAAGHPVTYEQLAKTFELPLWELREIVAEYAEKYNSSEVARGVTLITFDTCCQLCTKPEYIAPIRSALGIRKNGGTLSASTIEALTIIAYQQPVTRAYVDAVRNADSTYAVTNLLDRGLIEPKGRKDAPGRPILYGTTNAFLRSFGLRSLDDLPGSQGEAQGVFTAIDRRLHLDENDGQVTIDDLIGTASADPSDEDTLTAPAQFSYPIDDTTDAQEEDADNATEEAERHFADEP